MPSNDKNDKFTESQFQNIWGRSVGVLKEEVELIVSKETSPPSVKLSLIGSTKTDRIPEHAEVRLYISHHLRLIDESLGKCGQLFKTESTETDSISLSKFGEHWDNTRWELKITTSDEAGRVWAWTELKPIDRKSIIHIDGEGILFLQKGELDDVAWQMTFNDDGPTVVVNKSNSKLLDEFESASLSSTLIISEWVASIIDEMIILYLDNELIDADESSWQYKWGKWFRLNFGHIPNPFDSQFGEQMMIDCFRWKEKIVQEMKRRIDQVEKVNDFLSDRGDVE